jgi:hypothetical protein
MILPRSTRRALMGRAKYEFRQQRYAEAFR